MLADSWILRGADETAVGALLRPQSETLIRNCTPLSYYSLRRLATPRLLTQSP